jgi:Holliday junction resolvase
MRGKRAGTQRELAVRNHLRDRDWLAFRAPASLGVADVVAMKAGHRPQLIEVKSTANGPYEHFGPGDRQRLRFAAEIAGADAVLAWWPPRGTLRLIPSVEWPRQPHDPKLVSVAAYGRPPYICVVDESAGLDAVPP